MKIMTSDDTGFVSSREWNAFTRSCTSGHLLQSWTWGELKSLFGWQPLRLAVMEAGQIVAGAQVLFRRLPSGVLTTAYIPRGPMGDRTVLDLPALHQACRQRRAVTLLVEPEWEDNVESRTQLESQGFRPCEPAIQPRRTVVLDLRLSDEGLMSQMKPKTRYNIRLAERKGIQIRHGGSTDIPVFYELLHQTALRDTFGIHTRDYYSHAWDLFFREGAAAMLVAEYEAHPVAAVMVFAWGKRAYYMYGASSNDERQRMPTYLVQWHAMRWARSVGCDSYDLWGIPDLDDTTVGNDVAAAEQSGALSTGMGGLYRFKRGFGGRTVRYVATQERAYCPLLSRVLHAAWARREA
jgi:peptidoglycan pentaglycine glycine transferase (the first glycine)